MSESSEELQIFDPLLPPKQKRQRAEQKRAIEKIQIVITEAINVIERDGEAGVNLKDIAESTGVSYGAIYHHFGDRDGLIRAAQFERLRRQPGLDLESLEAALKNPGSAVDFISRIQQIADDIADPSRGAVRLERASVIASALSRPDLRTALEELEDDVYQRLRNLIIEAQKLGLADPSLDPGAAAIYLEALSFGVVLMEFVENRPTPAALSNLIFRGFAALLAR
jgi:AcrR family transcriptional regulator